MWATSTLAGLGISAGVLFWGLRLGGQFLVFWMTQQPRCTEAAKVAQALAQRRGCRSVLRVGRAAGAALWRSFRALRTLGTRCFGAKAPTGTLTHLSQRLLQRAEQGVFSDSGCWDSFLLRSFDRLIRALFGLTATPLSEHGAGERAGTKVLRELQKAAKVQPTRSSQPILRLLCTFAMGGGLLLMLGVALACLNGGLG